MCRLVSYEVKTLEQLDKKIDDIENQELICQLLNLKLELIKHLNQHEIALRSLELEERKLDYSPNYRSRHSNRFDNRNTNKLAF